MKILWKVKKMNNTDYHIPVMKHEAVSHLLSDRDGIYFDASFLKANLITELSSSALTPNILYSLLLIICLSRSMPPHHH